MSNGRVDVDLAPETVASILDVIGQIEEQMPFLLRLDAGEKQRLVKPRAGAVQVMQEIVAVQREAGMPVADNDPMLADLSVYDGLTSIGDRLAQLLRLIEDTRLQAGSEGWNQGLIRYGMLRQLERGQPELKTKLDRIQPLIISRSRRSNSGNNGTGEGTDEVVSEVEQVEQTAAPETAE